MLEVISELLVNELVIGRIDWDPKVFLSPQKHLFNLDEAADSNKKTVNQLRAFGISQLLCHELSRQSSRCRKTAARTPLVLVHLVGVATSGKFPQLGGTLVFSQGQNPCYPKGPS